MTLRSLALVMLTASLSILIVSCGGNEPAADPAADTTASVDVIPPDVPEPPTDERPLQDGFLRARHILVSWDGCGIRGVTRTRDEAAELIQLLLDRITAGEATFEQLAFEYSDCTTAPDSGMLPDFSRGAMVREFEDAAFALDSGEVSGIVETDFGFHLIKRVR